MTPSLPPSTIALLALAAFGAGLVDAIAGGGGLITVPALFAAHLPVPVALATNKGQAAFGAVSSFMSFWTRGEIDKERALLGFAGGFVGSLAGAALLLVVPSKPLKPVSLVLLMIAAAIVMWPRKPGHGTRRRWAMKALLPIAAALGFYDGFFGPGVGSMLIVAWVLVFGDAITRASGNAKVVNLGSNLAALLVFSVKGAVLWHVSAPMAIANACGSFLGARLAVKRGDRFVRTVVLLVVSALVLKMAYELVWPS
ncbi:MAG: TSUP family transporter [Labilithrix sp.]|nr:TSUP family transporter [Labilithrix sp.]MCW5817538.1 TSUP family transporter [Labilithrix sp.]